MASICVEFEPTFLYRCHMFTTGTLSSEVGVPEDEYRIG